MTTTKATKTHFSLLALVLCACGGTSTEIIYVGSDAAPPLAAVAPDAGPADPPPVIVDPPLDAGAVAPDAGESYAADTGAAEDAADASKGATDGAADASAVDAAEACVPLTIAEACPGPDGGQWCSPTVTFGCGPSTITGLVCGQVSDGCGGALLCPACPSPLLCGGGGVPGQCGCTQANTGPACIGVHP